ANALACLRMPAGVLGSSGAAGAAATAWLRLTGGAWPARLRPLSSGLCAVSAAALGFAAPSGFAAPLGFAAPSGLAAALPDPLSGGRTVSPDCAAGRVGSDGAAPPAAVASGPGALPARSSGRTTVLLSTGR